MRIQLKIAKWLYLEGNITHIYKFTKHTHVHTLIHMLRYTYGELATLRKEFWCKCFKIQTIKFPLKRIETFYGFFIIFIWMERSSNFCSLTYSLYTTLAPFTIALYFLFPIMLCYGKFWLDWASFRFTHRIPLSLLLLHVYFNCQKKSGGFSPCFLFYFSSSLFSGMDNLITESRFHSHPLAFAQFF